MVRRGFVLWYVGLLVAFAVLALLAHEQQFFAWDISLAQAWQSVRPPLLAGTMATTSALGHIAIAAALVLVAALLLFRQHRPLAAAFILGTFIADGLDWALKLTVGRPRPSPELLLVAQPTTEHSFPSGHVVHYTVFYGFLIFLVCRFVPAPRWRAALTVLLALPIVLVGPSRVYLGAHWPSDVIGGYLLGAAVLIALIWGYCRLSSRFE